MFNFSDVIIASDSDTLFKDGITLNLRNNLFESFFFDEDWVAKLNDIDTRQLCGRV